MEERHQHRRGRGRVSPRRIFTPDEPSPFEAQPGDLDYTTVDDDLAAEEEARSLEIASLHDEQAAEGRGAEIDDLAREGGLEWMS